MKHDDNVVYIDQIELRRNERAVIIGEIIMLAFGVLFIAVMCLAGWVVL